MNLTRRDMLKASFALAAYAMVPSLARASQPDGARILRFYNTHTGESLKTTYWENGIYHPQALNEIAHVLRDHRTGDEHAMDPQLLDLLSRLHKRMDSNRPFEVISGYRSPKSNAMLHDESMGVAVKSQHILGKAIDIRLTDRKLSALHDVAWDMQQGGVGYYPASNFVHVDTGRVRRW